MKLKINNHIIFYFKVDYTFKKGLFSSPLLYYLNLTNIFDPNLIRCNNILNLNLIGSDNIPDIYYLSLPIS
jgi:hypothetical protein